MKELHGLGTLPASCTSSWGERRIRRTARWPSSSGRASRYAPAQQGLSHEILPFSFCSQIAISSASKMAIGDALCSFDSFNGNYSLKINMR